LAGLEPAIFCSVGRRVIRCATRPCYEQWKNHFIYRRRAWAAAAAAPLNRLSLWSAWRPTSRAPLFAALLLLPTNIESYLPWLLPSHIIDSVQDYFIPRTQRAEIDLNALCRAAKKPRLSHYSCIMTPPCCSFWERLSDQSPQLRVDRRGDHFALLEPSVEWFTTDRFHRAWDVH
jgi:hypothetical protein